jgi:DNA-binding IclR family transcriptional regulator
MKNRPVYAISSVDSALRLAVILQLEGPMTVSEAAERIGVARSTAHRLLTTLCYRDFVVQDEDRRYHPGPVLGSAPTSARSSSRLRALALPHLAALTYAVDETSNLTVLSGRLVRFLASVECSQVLRVGTREGMAFPAHRTSGGLAMLAAMPREEVEARYGSVGDDLDGDVPPPATLRQQLAAVRRRGFAMNDGRTEKGIVALGMAVVDPRGGLAAVSLSMPSTRFSRDRIPAFVREMSRTKGRIEQDLQGVDDSRL